MRKRDLGRLVLVETREVALRGRGRGKSERDGRERGDED
jgi:hypothetical protein